jgi:hypothetical protein
MKRLAIVLGVLAIGFGAATAARADFSVIKFKDNGSCRAWAGANTKPASPYQVLWARVPTWEAAQAKGAWAMKHHWCRNWWK